MKLLHILTINLLLFMSALNARPQSNSTDAPFPGAFRLEQLDDQHNSNQIWAFRLSGEDGKNTAGRSLVIFDPKAKQALFVEATNNVYFLKGHLFLVSEDVQSFWLIFSRPLNTTTLSPAALGEIAKQSVEDWYPRENKFKTRVDLRVLLKAETDMSLAQPLGLRNVRPVVEDGRIVIYFESYMHIKGKVIFDDQLKPVSLSVISSPNLPRK